MNALVQSVSTSDMLRMQAAAAQGVKAVQGGNPGMALPHYEEALGIYRDPGILSNYGDALSRTGQPERAKAIFEEAIELAPDVALTWYNLGVTCERLADFEGARRAYREALARRVEAATANNLGNVETWLLNPEAAEPCYRQAISHGFNEAFYNLGLCLMMQGKFADGWWFYHFRPQMVQSGMVNQRPQAWRGEDLRGKTLVVITEQGLGDTVFALRYVPMLRERGARLVIACEAGLKRLIEAMVADTDPALPPVLVVEKTPAGIIPGVKHDYEVLMMSLPMYLSPDGVGPRQPYLKALGVPFPNDRVVNVGLCWNGSTAVGVPAERNIPLKLLAPLGAIPGVRFVSLQKGDGVDELAGCGFPVHDAMAGVRDVYDTACVIASLDLVITIDTMIPHLAGALGKPVWLMNRFGSCWQWGTPRQDPMLYSTVQQFRQEKRGDWSLVVEHLRAALENVARAWSPGASQ
jgi:Tfp pilus assembly protein PilF